jgi:hypothetical protein
MPTSRGFIPLAAACVALVACSSPSDPGNPPPPTSTITSVSLTAGGDGVINGTDLDRLPATLTLDGVIVTPTSRSATEVRFPMPTLRACETDGRPVTVSFGGLTRTTDALEVPGALTLAVGESRVLTRAEMDGCLELAAGPGMYVLTALHPTTDASGAVIPGPLDSLLVIRTWT